MSSSKKKHRQQKNCSCYACGKTPEQAEAKLLTIFNKSMNAKVPLVMPIMDPPFYSFTIGLPKLAPTSCDGELVITRLGGSQQDQYYDPQMSAQILTQLTRNIMDNKIKPMEWKEGSIVEQKFLNVSLRVHILSRDIVEKWLGTSRRPKLGIPATTRAYQILWADEENKFPNDHVSHQQCLDPIISTPTSTAASTAASTQAPAQAPAEASAQASAHAQQAAPQKHSK